VSSCEKCWRESGSAENYNALLESRQDHPCTPEEQAGPDASECPLCNRMVLHQHTGECMVGCKASKQDKAFKEHAKVLSRGG